MAERRMFAKTIIDSDAFLDMPLSAQALYFHLSMRADDDGFVNNPKRIQKTIGGSDDDYKILLAKNFIILFDSGIIVIKHWKIHNYIRGDRKKDTAYPEEMSMLSIKDNGSYTLKNVDGFANTIKCVNTNDFRKKAYEESSLPYCFDYKIRHEFYGKPCPVCGAKMADTVDECGVRDDSHRPTIQHNKPLSKGGKHELGNISVICRHCNISIQDNETGNLNSDEVIKVWDFISSDGQVTVNGRSMDGIGKDSIGKDSIVEDSNTPPNGGEPTWDTSKHTNVDNLKHVLNTGEYEQAQFFLDHKDVYESVKEWMAYKDRRKPKRDNHYTDIDKFLNTVVRKCNDYGTDNVINAINDTMGAGYQGIVWDYAAKCKSNKVQDFV